MIEVFEKIYNNKSICKFDFPAYYQERGKMMNLGIKSLPPISPFSSYIFEQTNEESRIIKEQFFNIFIDDRGYIALWYLNAMRKNDISMLDTVSSLFEKANKITRGGINIYKQSGWMVHVLYVFQLISFNIPNEVLPTSFSNATTELKETFHIMNKLYWKMTKESRFILKILALIHDIGVIDGIQNHDRDGEKYVTTILSDLGITSRTLYDNNITFSFEFFIEVLKILVSNHTLINKISAEESDECIRDKCQVILERLSFFKDINSEIVQDIAAIFLLIGMADLIAIDDSLFTVQKFALARSSYGFLNKIFLGLPSNRNKEDVAMMRLHQMLPENIYTDLKKDSLDVLKQLSVNSEQFWSGLYQIYEFEYAIAFLKPLKNLESILFVLSKIIDLISSKQGIYSFNKCIVIFDSSMNLSNFLAAIENGEFKECIENMYNQKICNGQVINMKLAIKNNSMLLLEISDRAFF